MPVPPPDEDPQPREPENDVLSMLRLNKEREAVREINQEIVYVKKPSRRKRDYWLTIVAGNLVLLLAALCLPRNPVTGVYLLAGFILFNSGITWVMWQVMDDY